jgi:LPXTG-site transpeptidase (sortase) family protein
MNMQKIPLIVKVVFLHFCLIFLTAGMLNVGAPSPVVSVTPITKAEKQLAKPIALTGEPAKISIPRLGIDLPIEDGVFDYSNNEWVVVDNAVNFARTTSLPSTGPSNTFMYGHNNNEVLGKTSGLVVGDELLIQTDNGRTFKYVFASDIVTDPSDTTILSAEYDKSILTLMTCSGFWSQERRLMQFNFVELR